MLERQRLDDAGLVVLEIVEGDRRTAGLQVGRDVAGQRAFVVVERATSGRPAEGLLGRLPCQL